MVFAYGVAKMVLAKLPMPWVNEQGYSSPPRRVHLSWRTAVRLPVYAPFLLILWHFLSILRMHFDIDWVLYCVITLAVGIMTIVISGVGVKSGSSEAVKWRWRLSMVEKTLQSGQTTESSIISGLPRGGCLRSGILCWI